MLHIPELQPAVLPTVLLLALSLTWLLRCVVAECRREAAMERARRCQRRDTLANLCALPLPHEQSR